MFREFDRDMAALLREFFAPEENGWKELTEFRPTANLAETDAAYEVTVDLPGVKPEDVRVEMRNGDLWITGERRDEKEEKGKTFHRTERTVGRFERMMPLPTTVTEEKIEAAFKDGVLKVTLPKTEKTVPHRIEVKAK
jgi:HSP20 family protein